MADSLIDADADSLDPEQDPGVTQFTAPTFDSLPTEVRQKILKWLFRGQTVILRTFRGSKFRQGCTTCDQPQPMFMESLCRFDNICARCAPSKPSALHSILLTCHKHHQEAQEIYFATVTLQILQVCHSKFIVEGGGSWRNFRQVSILQLSDEPRYYDDYWTAAIATLEKATQITYAASTKLWLCETPKKTQNMQQVLTLENPFDHRNKDDDYDPLLEAIQRMIRRMLCQVYNRAKSGTRTPQVLVSMPIALYSNEPVQVWPALFDDGESIEEVRQCNPRIIGVTLCSLDRPPADMSQNAFLDVKKGVLTCCLRGKTYDIKSDAYTTFEERGNRASMRCSSFAYDYAGSL